MKRLMFWIIAFCIFITVFGSALAKKEEINISAAASLKDVLLEVAKKYEDRNGYVRIHLNLASSGKIQTQIEHGAPCDLFFSAASKQMDALEKKGLIKSESRIDLLQNQLVLIVPNGAGTGIKSFEDLSSERIKKLGIAAPDSSPAGQYAREVLTFLKIWDAIQDKLVLGTNVRAALTYVETGNVDAGIVFLTDAMSSNKVKIVDVAPEGSHGFIRYPVAIVSYAEQPETAKEFLAFCQEEENKKIFYKHGFEVVSQK